MHFVRLANTLPNLPDLDGGEKELFVLLLSHRL